MGLERAERTVKVDGDAGLSRIMSVIGLGLIHSSPAAAVGFIAGMHPKNEIPRGSLFTHAIPIRDSPQTRSQLTSACG
jgi:hypothetical protein